MRDRSLNPRLPRFPSELKKRPSIRGVGRLLAPTQKMANSSLKELSEAATASPPFPPYGARNPQGLPWRMDAPSRHRAREGGKARQRRHGQHSPRLNASKPGRRILVAGSRAKVGGFGGQICLLPNHLEACVENNAEVMARLS